MSMFDNAHHFSVHGGVFNNVQRDQINIYEGRPALELLSEFLKGVGATHDSAQRYPPPKCHPKTRKEIQNAILEWIHSAHDERPICWIHGPAGVGKTAIAQTVAELSEMEKSLGASFFFSRNHLERGRAEYLFPTIVYQLAVRIEKFSDAISQTLRKNAGLLRSSLDVQFRDLFVDTCQLAMKLGGDWMHHPKVIIVDGLDECTETIFQQRIISLIASALKDKLPFRFLIFSRPEPQIHEAFYVMWSQLKLLVIDKDSWNTPNDLKTILDDGFINIRMHPRNAYMDIPHTWPAHEVIDELVEKACGQFVYANVVLSFVGEEHSHPVEQLSIILGLKSATRRRSPFKELDVLYHHILSSYPDHHKVVMILGTLIRLSGLSRLRRWNNHPCGPSIEVIEALLGLHTGEVALVLRGMHSVLKIDETHIQILHASFRDYLGHKSRSGRFY
ncbi:hypothetical protein J3R30DRAFT_2371354 [Lentinula aciculospora]|uniref:Nephrocystin 3-like N-terminal domain-containing protein n=1 Tax=Lentinula aciculospora TaxID=153920 RepID=A0A9W9DQ31_9AGAR|nr:hypothetical protein J3R30DRAFT_2371354 [Lentinula aciculospora]